MFMHIIEEINKLCKGTFIENLGIEFTHAGEGFVEAKMIIDETKLQPFGFLHGGASLALAETVASGGSLLLIDRNKYAAFGLQVSGNHIATMGKGTLFARAEIVHKGRSTHVWDVKMESDEKTLISVVRVTMSIIAKKATDRS